MQFEFAEAELLAVLEAFAARAGFPSFLLRFDAYRGRFEGDGGAENTAEGMAFECSPNLEKDNCLQCE